MQASYPPEINGTPIEPGDNIGIFTPRGLCAGYTMWDGVNTSITIWGENSIEEGIARFLADETMVFKVWDMSDNIEYVLNPSFSKGNNKYLTDGIYILSSLENTAVDMSFNLTSGLNQISIPIMLADYSITSVFDSIHENIGVFH